MIFNLPIYRIIICVVGKDKGGKIICFLLLYKISRKIIGKIFFIIIGTSLIVEKLSIIKKKLNKALTMNVVIISIEYYDVVDKWDH